MYYLLATYTLLYTCIYPASLKTFNKCKQLQNFAKFCYGILLEGEKITTNTEQVCHLVFFSEPGVNTSKT